MELGFSEDFLFEKCAAGAKMRVGEAAAIGHRFSAGWGAPEGTHRWTTGGVARLPNPHQGGDVAIRFSNMLALEKKVTFRSGTAIAARTVGPGATGEVMLHSADGDTIDIECEGHRPADINPGSADTRSLGIAISEMNLSVFDIRRLLVRLVAQQLA